MSSLCSCVRRAGCHEHRSDPRDGRRRRRRRARPDLALDRCRARHRGRRILRTGREAVDQIDASSPMSWSSTSRCRTSTASRRCRCCSRKARSHRHHGVDADAAERRSQPEGAVARRDRLYPKAGEQSRARLPRIRSATNSSRRSVISPRRLAAPPRPDAAFGAGRRAAAAVAAAGALRRRQRSCSAPAIKAGRARLLIGASTGGPQALTALAAKLAPISTAHRC